MKYEVTDVSGSLWQIYQEMDPCILEVHVTEVSQNFAFVPVDLLQRHVVNMRWITLINRINV